MARQASKIKDNDGTIIREGDVLYSAYGIPPLRILGVVFREGGKLHVRTTGHKPPQTTLAEFKKLLGDIWIEPQKTVIS